MDVLRLTTITLSLTFLVACGGGGGGGTPAAGGGGGGGPQVRLEALPDSFIPEQTVREIRMIVGGTLPDPLPQASDLEMKVVGIAGMSDALLFSETASAPGIGINASRMIICTPGEATCTAMIDTNTTDQMPPEEQMQDPEDIDGPVLFYSGEGLAGYNDAYDIVMADEGVPLVQMRAAGRDDAGARFAYQGYGGWLDHSVFLIQEQTTMMMGEQVSSLSVYSFGDATRRNPTTNARWDGVMIGSAGGDIIQGDAVIQWDKDTPNAVGGLFNNIKNLSEEDDYTETLITWKSVPLMEGGFFTSDDAFLNVNGSISGYFYGNSHEEVGGIFNVGELFGAFGAKKQ